MSSESNKDVVVNYPMIKKIERVCRGYIDQLEKGGKEYDIQKFLMLYIFASTTNTEYRTKLFDLWPTYMEDFENAKSIMGYRYPETLCDEFLALKMDKNIRILDVACGPGNVAYILRKQGYTNIDGLDPSQGLLNVGIKNKLFDKTYCCFVTADEQTPIEDNAYDVLLCSAGMFPGSIVPQAFKELIRITKPGGILAWNIADDYEGFNEFFKSYDSIIEQHVTDGNWEFVQPTKKLQNVLFEDSGYINIMRKK